MHHGIVVSKLAFSILAAREADRLLRESGDEMPPARVAVLLEMLDHDCSIIDAARRALLKLDSFERADVFSALQPHLDPEEFFSFVYSAREQAIASHEEEQAALDE